MTAIRWLAAQAGYLLIEVSDALDIPFLTPAGYRLGNWLSNLKGAA